MKYLYKFAAICFFIFLIFVIFINIRALYSCEYTPDGNINKLIFFTAIATVAIVFYALCIYIKKIDFNKKSYILTIFAMLFLGFVLRFIALINLPCKSVSDYKTIFDAAQAAANGDFTGFSNTSYLKRFPHLTGYTVMLYFIFKTFGANLFIIKIVNIMCSVLSIVVAAMIGKQMGGYKGGAVCAFLYSIYPADIFYIPVCITENFAMPFFILAIYFIIKAYKASDTKTIIIYTLVSSVILCIGCIFRGVTPFYITAFVVFIVFAFKNKLKIISVIAFLLSFFIINQAVSLGLYYGRITQYKLNEAGEPIAMTLLVGFNFETNGMYSWEDRNIYVENNGDTEIASKIATEKLKERIGNNKDKIIHLFINKSKIIWENGAFGSLYWSVENNGYNMDTPRNVWLYLLNTVYFLILLLASLKSSIHNQDKPYILFEMLPLLFHCGLMLIEVQPRYTFCVAYVFIFCAMLGFVKNKLKG